MVETSRPAFYTFPLQSEPRNSGDALTYYDYQRAIRSKDVKTLQQLRERSVALIGAGDKKPVAHSVTSRKIFQLLNHPVKVASVTFPEGAKATSKDPSPVDEKIHKSAHASVVNTDTNTSQDTGDPRVSLSSLRPSSAAKDKMAVRPPSAKEKMAEVTTRPQTERLPTIARPLRSIKSATARDHYLSPESSVVSPPEISQRPKTVASTRDIEIQECREKG